MTLGVDALGSFNNRTLAISSLGVLLLQLGFNSTPDIPTKELTAQFSKELVTLQEEQQFLNSTHYQLAIVPMLDKTEVLVAMDEYEPLHISSDRAPFTNLLYIFIQEGLKFVDAAQRGLIGDEFDNRIQFLSKVANGPLFQGSSSIAKEFYKNYTEKTEGFNGLFRILVSSLLLLIFLWNLINTGILYYLKNTMKRFLRLFEGYLKVSRETSIRHDTSRHESFRHEKEGEEIHLPIDTIGVPASPKKIGSLDGVDKGDSFKKPESRIALEKDEETFKRSDSIQPALRGEESILDRFQFQLSIKRTLREGIFILTVYLLLLGWMTYREEIFLDKIIDGLAHINHLESRASAIQNLNNMAMYEAVVHEPPRYAGIGSIYYRIKLKCGILLGIDLKNQSIYAVINEEKRINQTAKTLQGGSFEKYLKKLYDFNHFDVCQLLYEGVSETQKKGKII